MRPSFVAAGLALAALLASAPFVACQLVFPTVVGGADADAAGDAASPDGTGGDATFIDVGCGVLPPAEVPGAPSNGTSSTYSAVQSFVFTEPDAGQLLGYDLDGVCTCPGPPSCISPVMHCDLPGGRDISGNQLLALVDTFLQGSPVGSIQTQIAAGQIGLLVWVIDYNGEVNDDGVGVAVLESTGIIVDPEAGTTQPPKWDGNDEWNVDPASVAGITMIDGGYVYTPNGFSSVGYVTNHVLVANLPSLQLRVGGTLVLTNVILTAVISPDHGGFDLLQGTIAGRISTHELQVFASTYRDPFDRSQFLCGSDPTFQSFKMDICAAADIMHQPALDNTGANCDALSIAIGFSALAAKVGSPYAGKVSVAGCDGGIVECSP